MKDIQFNNPAAIGALARGDLANALIAATPGGIEAQEAQGQRELVYAERTKLPQECSACERADFEAMGIIFHENADDLFIYVTLPDGWKLEPTAHTMWSYLVDNQGRKRVSIFYKAAFYDRKAYIGVVHFYKVVDRYFISDGEVTEGHSPASIQGVVENGNGETVFQTVPIQHDDWNARDVMYKQCRAWLNEHYPEWCNPTAYWE